MTYASIGYMLLGHYLSVCLSSPAKPKQFRLDPFGRISSDLLGDPPDVVHDGQTERSLFRGDGRVYLSGCLGHMGPVSNRPSFANRQEADRLYVQSLLLHLSHAYFLFAGIRAMGPPGH